MLPPISFFSLGFISTALQVILLRQMAVAFGGNEMAWGIILACWLWWVALGSYLGGKIVPQLTSPRKTLFLSFFLLSALSPLIALAPQAVRLALGLPPGQIVGMFPLTLAVFLITALPCLLLGGLFTLCARWAREEKKETRFGGMIAVYWWEALGAAAGGIYPSLLFYGGIKDEHTLYSLAILGAALAAGLFPLERSWPNVLRRMGALFIIALLLVGVEEGHRYFNKKQWGGHQLKASVSSIYGRIDVLTYEEQISFYQNGLLTFSYPDNLSAEEAVHYALLQHPHPQRVLLIGTGLGGAVPQALKHKELSLVYGELDAAMIKAAQKFLPAETSEVLNSTRVKIILGDVRPRLMQSQELFDVVILNLPGPANAQLNRYYTVEFFEAVKSNLAPQGVLGFKVAASEDYWSPNLLRYLNTLRHTLEKCFPEVLVIPGGSALYLAAPQTGVLTTKLQVLSQRYRERKLSNQFVNPQLLPFRLRADRIKELKEKLDRSPYELNRDLRPISYLYDSILWSAHFGGWERKIMGALSRIKPHWLWVPFLVIPGLFFLLGTSLKGQAPAARYLCLFANGLTTMALEIILLLIFQVYYGYVYFLLGLLIALFMVGLSLGSWGGRRYLAEKFTKKTLIFLQGVLILVPFCMFLILGNPDSFPGARTTQAILLSLMMLLMGVVGGLHFAGFSHGILASSGESRDNQAPANLGGPYAADLTGSSLGALIIAALFIPLLGIPPTLILLGVFNLMALGFLAISLKRRTG